MLRIRDKVDIKQLNIPRDELDYLQKIVTSNRLAEKTKLNIIRKLTDGTPCCLCAGIPSVELSYRVGPSRVIERYCKGCMDKVFTRESLEPKNKDPYEIAEYYGCTKVDQIAASKLTF